MYRFLSWLDHLGELLNAGEHEKDLDNAGWRDLGGES